MGVISSTCLSSPWTNAHGWMRIIKRYGKKYLHCSRATQEPKRGCIASARHCDAEVGFDYLTPGPNGILVCTRVVCSFLDMGSSVETERCDHPQLRGRNIACVVLTSDNKPLFCETQSSYSSKGHQVQLRWLQCSAATY